MFIFASGTEHILAEAHTYSWSARRALFGHTTTFIFILFLSTDIHFYFPQDTAAQYFHSLMWIFTFLDYHLIKWTLIRVEPSRLIVWVRLVVRIVHFSPVVFSLQSNKKENKIINLCGFVYVRTMQQHRFSF